MQKVAVFGKPGSGKSTLSKALAKARDLPLYQLDSLVYQPNGELAPQDLFEQQHQKILQSEHWVMDGFGPLSAFNQRLAAADTLVYIDLPYAISYWLVTKRLLKGLFVKPEGWPDGSSVLKGSIQSYKTLRMCPRFWNEDFVKNLKQLAAGKSLFIIRSLDELNHFAENVTHQ
ncbi:adenylate kinase [Neptunicella marina]|uniref:Adenylate kinase n=1 Tax=Neptunicella marina TaxID=2125989 RepID=A0A8J6IVS7_9ALTE|nr:adenylate kinase [Neptunicella marina]MBC3767119.1 adenylate kinase [Neptunicella marina]